MSIRNLTWQQVVVCVALLAAVVIAYKMLGELPAGVLVVVTAIVNLLLGRDHSPRRAPVPQPRAVTPPPANGSGS